MPIEIRELIIRAVVDNTQTVAERTPEGQTSHSEEAIVASCVAQVLRILKKEKER